MKNCHSDKVWDDNSSYDLSINIFFGKLRTRETEKVIIEREKS